MLSVSTIIALAKAGIFTEMFIPHGMTAGLTKFLNFTLATLVCGGVAQSILINKRQNKHKLANGHLISKNDILDILGNDGLILSKDIQLKEKYNFEGSVVFGATGSKKTTGFYIPNLLNPNLRGSIIVGDPSGELFELTSNFQKNVCGRKVLRFAPLEPDYSEKCNLLTTYKTNDEVKELATSLLFNGGLTIELSTGRKSTSGAEWIQMSEGLLSAALLYAKDLGYPYDNVEFALQLILTLDTKRLDVLFSNSKNYDCVTQWNTFKSVGGADRTEGSIKITLSSNMRIFTDSRISKINSVSTFDFKDFRKEPTILYLCYPEHKAKYIAPYTAPFLNKMLDTFIEEYKKDDPNCLPISCYFDEFCDLGLILDMPTKARTVRKREISLNICIQGLTQLFQVYGTENGYSILNNLKTKMIFPSMSDIKALDYISQLCGEQEIEVINKSENKNGSSTSYSKTKKMMFSKSDLRCLDSDKLLVLISNNQPILTDQNTYFNNPIYKERVKEPIEIKRQVLNKNDYRKYLEDLKIDLVISEEVKYDIRKEWLR